MSLIDTTRHCFLLLLALTLGLTITTGCSGGGTNPDPGVGNGDDTPDTTVSSITATTLWEMVTTSTTEPATPAFDPPFGGEDLRIINGDQIRVTVKTYYDAVPQRLVLYSLDSSGQVLWELEIPFVSDYAPYVRSSTRLLTTDGWLFLLVDWYEEPDDLLQIVAISPEGEIAWTAKPPDGLIDSHWDEYNQIFLDSNERLLATDFYKRLYLLDRDGQVVEYIDDAFADFNRTRWLSTCLADEGLYILEHRDYLGELGARWPEDLYDYYINGYTKLAGDSVLLVNSNFIIRSSFNTSSIINRVAPRPGGGLIIGGDAGKVAAFDVDGTELWRYIPDQSRTFDYAWSYVSWQHWPDWDMPIGVSGMELTDQGTVCVTTYCGNLYAVGAGGNLRWSWPNACGSPVIDKGYGVDHYSFYYPVYSGIYSPEVGTVRSGSLTLDPETGDLLDVTAHTGADYIIETSDGQTMLCSEFTITTIDQVGTELSQYILPDRIMCLPAVSPDDSLIIPTARGRLYSLSSGGVIQWEANIGCQVQCRPAVTADGRVFVIDIEGTLTALSATGGILWTLDGMSTELLPPVVGPDGVAVVTGDDQVAWINFDGTVIWEYPNEDELLAPPAVSSTGLIAWGDKRGRVYLVDSAGDLVYQHFDETVEKSYYGIRVTQSPVFMPDGSLVVEFADWPFYGDCFPYTLYSTVKCLAPDGSVTWALLDEENRYRNSFNWGEPIRLLLSPGLVNGEYVLLGLVDGIWLYDETGLVCELSTTENTSTWLDAAGIFPSSRNGIYTTDTHDAAWSEINIQLP